MGSHFEESLQRDSKVIRSKVLEMAALADRALKDSLRALTERNRQLAYSVIKINLELERIGDYAESIARHVLKISSLEPQPSYEKFVAIATLSIPMLQQAVQAFVDQNPALARSTMVIEEEVDTLRNGINAALVKQYTDGKIPLETFTSLLTIARRFERVSDQAKNICEEVLYLCTGEYVKHKGTAALRVQSGVDAV